MAAIDTVYNYYLSTYANSTVSRYDSHKKSELRDIYNKIVKTNQESPLYKIQESGDVTKFAIDVKESARQIKNVISSLSTDDSGIESAFSKKVATSSNEEVVTAKYIGSGKESETMNDFEIEVRQLATPQINTGNFLPNGGRDIAVGSYSFDLNTPSASYEFQYNVNEGETNKDILDKLARLVNNADIGLKAEVLSNDKAESALNLYSTQTGLSNDETSLFEIIPEGTTGSYAAMRTLGMNHITHPAENSSFLLNGKEHSSYSNTITINKTFELTLKNVSTPGETETVGYKTSVDAIADNLNELIDSYNSVIDIATNHTGASQQGNRLLNDMKSVPNTYANELEAIGLKTTADGKIHLDRALLSDAISSEDAKESFSVLNAFKDALNEKATKASINPMNYVNKVVVAYKNPNHIQATPYISSVYSGLMLDRYC